MKWMTDRTKKCKWFNGLMHDECKAGIRYALVVVTHEEREVEGVRRTKTHPCLVESCTTCSARTYYTADELAEQDREMEERLADMKAGVSSCCKAPLDLSHVIKRPGHRHDGHGSRFCSKCGKLAFMV